MPYQSTETVLAQIIYYFKEFAELEESLILSTSSTV